MTALQQDRLAKLVAFLNQAGQDVSPLAELINLVEALQQEVERLRQQLQQAEKERGQLLVAWSRERISDEELDRRSKEGGGCSTAELLQRLEQSCAAP